MRKQRIGFQDGANTPTWPRAQRYKVQLHMPRDDGFRPSRDWFSDDLVAIAKAPAPDPIPNSAVKAFSAHGTAS